MRYTLALSLIFLLYLYSAVSAQGSDFIEAVKSGDFEYVKTALANDPSKVNATNEQKFTSLHWAGIRAHWDLFFLLLEYGPDLNAVGGDGGTPLHVANRAGHRDLIELFIARGAALDAEGKIPGDMLIQRPARIELDAAGYDEYIGVYDLGQGYECKVWKQGDRLRFMEFAPDEIYPIAQARFFCRQEPREIRFWRDENGEVSRIEVDFIRRTVSGEKAKRRH